MANQQKILIFTSRTGGGHISLAEALRDRLEGEYTIEMLDPQPSLVHLHYRVVSRHALWLWSAEFRLSDTPARSKLAHRVYTLLLARHVKEALRRSEPDIVLTTYPFLTCEVKQAMHQLGRQAPFAMLLADPNGVHQSWLTERECSAIFAPTRETFRQSLEIGFREDQVVLTGWPVRGQFYRTLPPPDETLSALGLQPGRFTVFLQGGGEGAARFIKTVETLRALPGIQLIVAAGTNKELLRRSSGLKDVYVLPFTKDIARYISAADVVMGKAGPNMLFEAVTLGKPFIATTFIPGQEQANLAFIRRHGLGWVALSGASQRLLLSRLAENPTMLEAMRASVARYRDWNNAAVEQIPAYVRSLAPVPHAARD